MSGNNIIPRLKEKYQKEVIPAFMDKYNLKNKFEVPRIEKVVVNTSLGKTIEEPKLLDKAVEVIAKITGQRPIKTKAKKSVAAFKLKEDFPIGAKVTLRSDRMYEFLDRLISVALPRVRDFRGLSLKSFDGNGNYTIGISEIIVFPEAATEEESFGIEITIVTNSNDDNKTKDLLDMLGFPFKKD